MPTLKGWQQDYSRAREDAQLARDLAKANKQKQEAGPEDSDEEEAGHVVENEEETKEVKVDRPEWKRRYHLVVTARNQEGLHNIYRMVKRSFREGYYMYPRIDFDMLKEHGEGLFVSTACLGGIFSQRILNGQVRGKSRAEIFSELDNLTDRFVDAVGRDNFALELQFNTLDAQHAVNDMLLEHASRTGLPLIATADSHYPTPDHWEARELYKQLGWMGRQGEIRPLPKREDLKCELYPKNAQQMWDEYLRHRDNFDFYEGRDEVIKESIERAHDLVWNRFEDVWIDTKVKLPSFNRPDKTEFQQLAELVWEGARKEKLDQQPDYVARLEHELSDIEYMGFSPYFLVMFQTFNEAAQETLFGCGRGSAAGSLVNYCLGITQVDPLKYGLLWERFLGRHRCLVGSTLVMTESGPKRLDQIREGDKVLTHAGELKVVTETAREVHDVAYRIHVGDQTFTCAPNHRWMVLRDGKQVEVMACELRAEDELISLTQ